MKNNKFFWPIVILAIVIIAESIMYFSSSRQEAVVEKTNEVSLTQTETGTSPEQDEGQLVFVWSQEKEGKRVLSMTAQKDLGIGAIDLYIGFKDMKVMAAKNSGELPAPTTLNVSENKGLIEAHYLISNAKGFSVESGKSVKILEITSSSTGVNPTIYVDKKTQVVENEAARVIPYL